MCNDATKDLYQLHALTYEGTIRDLHMPRQKVCLGLCDKQSTGLQVQTLPKTNCPSVVVFQTLTSARFQSLKFNMLATNAAVSMRHVLEMHTEARTHTPTAPSASLNEAGGMATSSSQSTALVFAAMAAVALCCGARTGKSASESVRSC